MRRLIDLTGLVLESALDVLQAKLTAIAENTAATQLDWYARGYASGVVEGRDQATAEADQGEA